MEVSLDNQMLQAVLSEDLDTVSLLLSKGTYGKANSTRKYYLFTQLYFCKMT